ncbi:MAG: hypothetical protein ACFFBC_13195 [Promethearchaeota archaeon]
MRDKTLNNNLEKRVVNLPMPINVNIKDEGDNIQGFIDFDKDTSQLYNNLFLNDFKIVIKIPLIEKEFSQPEIKVEKFSLVDDVFLTSY